MIVDEKNKKPTAMRTELIESTVEGTIANVLKVRYTSSTEGVRASMFQLADKALSDLSYRVLWKCFWYLKSMKYLNQSIFRNALLGNVREKRFNQTSGAFHET